MPKASRPSGTGISSRKLRRWKADPDLLYRAIVNLLANALQAMPQGGVLRIRTVLTNSR